MNNDDVVVRKGENGWVVGNEKVSDLTSAMVLADLFAAEKARTAEASRPPAPPRSGSRAGDHGPGGRQNPAGEAERLAVTVAQLEHALASRVKVEQAIGVLAERHRLRPRDSFDLLRRAARSRGVRVTDLAQDVVASASNPLLRLPEELARTLPEPRPRGTRSVRRSTGRHAQRA
ncbi:MAG: ANTAR domain-containing protein [Streptosporangiales bacterium]|jgi:hypothetical protein|nr:ANTAR domain-containing protein [Streptosporangiales bacterium]